MRKLNKLNLFITAVFAGLLLGGLSCGAVSFSRAAERSFEIISEKGLKSSNIHKNDYETWSKVMDSYLFRSKDGGFNRVEHKGKYLYSENYNSDFKYISGKKVALELPEFGGVYRSNDAYFVVLGKNNKKEAKGRTEFRIIKYDLSWRKLASADIKDANTVEPFQFGSLRFAEADGSLYIRTCHTMYKSEDGFNHQASVLIRVRMSDCAVITSHADIADVGVGYVSHSFNQFLDISSGVLYNCDQGDGYPRGIAMIKINELTEGNEYFGNDAQVVVARSFSGKTEDIETGAKLGGFAVSGTHAFAVGSSVPNGKNLSCGVQNIFISSVSLSNFSKSGCNNYFLTSYKEGGKRTVACPQMLKIKGDRYALLWEEYVGEKFDRMCYTMLDGEGKRVTAIKNIEVPLSDCQPIFDGKYIVWYVTDGGEPSFYSLPVDGSVLMPEKGSVFTKNGIQYKITKIGNKTGNIAIVGCGNAKKKFSIVGKGEMGAGSSITMDGEMRYGGCRFSISSIGDGAFKNCKKLQQLTIPKTVKSIGAEAFSGCKNLGSVDIYGVKSIGNRAFKNCKRLQQLTIPKTVKSIGREAFSGCKNLRWVDIYGGVKSIGDKAFKNCKRIQQLTIPKTVKSIGAGAFAGCKNLGSVDIYGGVKSIGDKAFKNCKRLQRLTIPKTVKSIGREAFKGVKKSVQVVVPKSKAGAYKKLLRKRGISKKATFFRTKGFFLIPV